MTITVEIVDGFASQADINDIYSYFRSVEKRFSVFNTNSEISRINRGEIKKEDFSKDMISVFELAEKTKNQTGGYFDIITKDKKYNPSGIVKGWAIYNASKILLSQGYKNFYIDAGGDIQAHGKNKYGFDWKIGIKNPFSQTQIVKVIGLKNMGIATSGTYIRGQHIYDPFNRSKVLTEIISLSVIGPDVLEADRFATAAFAMGKQGIDFIENVEFLEAYMIDKDGFEVKTSGFEKYYISKSDQFKNV